MQEHLNHPLSFNKLNFRLTQIYLSDQINKFNSADQDQFLKIIALIQKYYMNCINNLERVRATILIQKKKSTMASHRNAINIILWNATNVENKMEKHHKFLKTITQVSQLSINHDSSQKISSKFQATEYTNKTDYQISKTRGGVLIGLYTKTLQQKTPLFFFFNVGEIFQRRPGPLRDDPG